MPLAKFMPPGVERDLPPPPTITRPEPSFMFDGSVGYPPHGGWDLSDEELNQLPPLARSAREGYFRQFTPEQRTEYEEYRGYSEEWSRWEGKRRDLDAAMRKARLKRYKFLTGFGVIPSFGAFVLGLLCFGIGVLINLI